MGLGRVWCVEAALRPEGALRVRAVRCAGPTA